MTISESRSIVSYLHPELPDEIPRHELVKGLVMFAAEHKPGDIILFHEDTSVDRDGDGIVFAPLPQ